MTSPFPIRPIIEHYAHHPPPHKHGWVKLKCLTHDERQPSATFNEEAGLYHCFAENYTADAIGLVKRIEGVEYEDAVKICEDITGTVQARQMVVPREKPRPGVLKGGGQKIVTHRTTRRKGGWR